MHTSGPGTVCLFFSVLAGSCLVLLVGCYNKHPTVHSSSSQGTLDFSIPSNVSFFFAIACSFFFFLWSTLFPERLWSSPFPERSRSEPPLRSASDSLSLWPFCFFCVTKAAFFPFFFFFNVSSSPPPSIHSCNCIFARLANSSCSFANSSAVFFFLRTNGASISKKRWCFTFSAKPGAQADECPFNFNRRGCCWK